MSGINALIRRDRTTPAQPLSLPVSLSLIATVWGNTGKARACTQLFSCVQLFAILWTVAHTPVSSCPWDFLSKNTGLPLFVRGSSWVFWPRAWTCISRVSYIGRHILYHWATWEAHNEKVATCKSRSGLLWGIISAGTVILDFLFFRTVKNYFVL